MKTITGMVKKEFIYNVPKEIFIVVGLGIFGLILLYLVSNEVILIIIAIILSLIFLLNMWRYINGTTTNSRIVFTTDGIYIPRYLLNNQNSYIKYENITKINGINLYEPEVSIIYIYENNKRHDIDQYMIESIEERQELINILNNFAKEHL